MKCDGVLDTSNHLIIDSVNNPDSLIKNSKNKNSIMNNTNNR